MLELIEGFREDIDGYIKLNSSNWDIKVSNSQSF